MLLGPHCEGLALLDAIDSNLRKEYTLEGVYQWMTHHIIPMHVLAGEQPGALAVGNSKPDICVTCILH